MHSTLERMLMNVSLPSSLISQLVLQVTDVKQAADYVAQLRRVGPGHGSWDWDRALLNGQPPATPSAA